MISSHMRAEHTDADTTCLYGEHIAHNPHIVCVVWRELRKKQTHRSFRSLRWRTQKGFAIPTNCGSWSCERPPVRTSTTSSIRLIYIVLRKLIALMARTNCGQLVAHGKELAKLNTNTNAGQYVSCAHPSLRNYKLRFFCCCAINFISVRFVRSSFLISNVLAMACDCLRLLRLPSSRPFRGIHLQSEVRTPRETLSQHNGS